MELSVFAFCDGEQMILVPPACDYKRIYDDDEGPNTGGMGSYSPPEFVTDKLMADIRDTIIRPVLRRMVETRRALQRHPLRRAHAHRRRPQGH